VKSGEPFNDVCALLRFCTHSNSVSVVRSGVVLFCMLCVIWNIVKTCDSITDMFARYQVKSFNWRV
jgi:hypothetical protein